MGQRIINFKESTVGRIISKIITRTLLMTTIFVMFTIAPISMPTVHAITYTLTITADTTLTEDQNGNIIIAANDVTLDCNGHIVNGTGVGNGILLERRTNVTVKNCFVTNFERGFFLNNSVGNTFVKNMLRIMKEGSCFSPVLMETYFTKTGLTTTPLMVSTSILPMRTPSREIWPSIT